MAHTDLITRVILKLDWSYALQVGGTISMVCFLVVVVLIAVLIVLDVVVFLVGVHILGTVVEKHSNLRGWAAAQPFKGSIEPLRLECLSIDCSLVVVIYQPPND